MTPRPLTGGRRRVDILQNEVDHGRLTLMALDAARPIQLALEGVERTGSSCWGDRVGGSRNPDAGALHQVEAARRAAWAVDRVERTVGSTDALVVFAVLGENLSFAETALRNGRTGRRATSDIAARFRDALERLALAQKAVGAVPDKVIDKHSRAAEAISAQKRVDRAA